MLFPRLSLRLLFALTVGFALVAFIGTLAARGNLLAQAVSVILAAVVLLLLVYAAAFGVIFAYASLVHGDRSQRGPAPSVAPAAPRPKMPGPEGLAASQSPGTMLAVEDPIPSDDSSQRQV